MAFQEVKFEFPHEREEKDIEIEKSSAIEVDVGGKGFNTRGEKIQKEVEVEVDDKPAAKAKKEPEASDDEFEIEIVDDTPKADRGRKPSEPPPDVTEEELETYSKDVQKRIKHAHKSMHDERRAKEAAERERDELQRAMQAIMEENQKLKESGTKSQKALIAQAKTNAEAEYAKAKDVYRAAYDAGDADKVLEAQEALINAKSKLDRITNYRIPTGQNESSGVQVTTNSENQKQSVQPQATPVDERAQDWAEKNPWFGKDEEMTALAYGYHQKLVQQGVDPTSDEYYEKIDTRMRQVFPDQFEDAEEERPPQRQKSDNVVAPATRSTAPKKIRLTQSQVRVARRLGLTPEQYARQVAIDMRKQ